MNWLLSTTIGATVLMSGMAVAPAGAQIADSVRRGQPVQDEVSPRNREMSGRSTLAAAVIEAASRHAELLEQDQGVAAERRASCRKRTARGAAIGAGIGAALAAGLLGATGGSDSTFEILFKFTGAGAVGGLAIGAAGCGDPSATMPPNVSARTDHRTSARAQRLGSRP